MIIHNVAIASKGNYRRRDRRSYRRYLAWSSEKRACRLVVHPAQPASGNFKGALRFIRATAALTMLISPTNPIGAVATTASSSLETYSRLPCCFNHYDNCIGPNRYNSRGLLRKRNGNRKGRRSQEYQPVGRCIG
jgi:hypothetical protein